MLFTRGMRILVADEARALLLENIGTAEAPEFRVLGERKAEGMAGYADRPGRENSATGHGTAFSQGDPAREGQLRFARALVGFLGAHGGSGKLIVVAPPRMLAALRAEMPPALAARVVAELDKTLTGHPLPDVAKVLSAALDPV